jgi:hypothetical protein
MMNLIPVFFSMNIDMDVVSNQNLQMELVDKNKNYPPEISLVFYSTLDSETRKLYQFTPAVQIAILQTMIIEAKGKVA